VELQIKVFTSFSGISALEKIQLIDFFGQSEKVVSAIDAALKHVPSFGGFLVEAISNHKIIGAAIINHSGMGGFFPNSIISYFSVSESIEDQLLVVEKMLKDIFKHTEGKIAIFLKPTHPIFKILKDHQFSEAGRMLVH